MNLYWYQTLAVERIEASLAEHRSSLIVMATGTGKTVVFCEMAKRTPGRILVVAHRDELIGQAVSRLEQYTDEYVDVEKAERFAESARIIVASIQTLSQPRRLQRFSPDTFSLVIIDEAHHAVASSYRAVTDYFTAKVLGVTATPDRGDEKALGRLFEDVAYQFDIQEAIEAGHLVPIRGIESTIHEINLDNVGLSAGDLAAGALDSEVFKGAEGIVNEVLALHEGRQGLCFFPGVTSAHLAADRFNAHQEGLAKAIDGTTPYHERRAAVEAFRNGDIKFLCNCGVFTEGFDAPSCSLVVQARPTKSRALYAQIIGRGTRPLPGTVEAHREQEEAELRRSAIASSPKRDLLVLDMVGNNTKHSLCSVIDVLGGNYDPDVVKEAKRLQKLAPAQDYQKLLEEADRHLIRLRDIKSSVKSSRNNFDPFSTLHIKRDREESIIRLRYGAKQPSDKQKEKLRNAGVPNESLGSMTSSDASKLIGAMIVRRKKGLATFKQLSVLAKYGISKPNISFARASHTIDYIAENNWKPNQRTLLEMVSRKRQPGED